MILGHSKAPYRVERKLRAETMFNRIELKIKYGEEKPHNDEHSPDAE